MAGRLLIDAPADGVRRLTISNPDKRNALDHAILDAIAAEVAGVPADVACLLITCAGGMFSSGYDLGGIEDDKRVALRDRLALFAEDLLDRALVLCLHGHLHLHGLEDHDGVALLDLLTYLHLDLPHGSGDVRLDVGQLRPPPGLAVVRHDTRPWSGNWRWW